MISNDGLNVGPHRSRRYTPPASGTDVPDGTVGDVLDWVGDDRDRAMEALDAEAERDRPRVTLIDSIEAAFTVPDPDTSDDADAEPEDQSSPED